MKLKEYREELKYKMRKTPKLIPYFENLVGLYIGNNKNIEEVNSDKEISNLKIEYINRVLEKFYANRNLFKNINLEIRGRKLDYSYMKDAYIVWKSLEDFDDNMSNEIYKSKVFKYQNSILREKIDLADEETFEKFSTLYDLNINKERISKELKKIKAFEISEQLNNCLDKVLEIVNEKTIDDYIREANEDDNCEIVSTDNNILILDIKSYEASKKFGSSQWCISYDENNWDDYLYSTGDDEGDFYYEKVEKNNTFFIIDFNKKPYNNMFKYALTTLPSSKIIFAHDKNDEDIMYDMKYNPDFECLKKTIGNYIYNKEKNNNFKESPLECDYINEIDYDKKNQIKFLAMEMEDSEESLKDDYDEGAEEEFKEFLKDGDKLMNEFCETPYGQSLLINGDEETINSLIKFKERTGSFISYEIVKSFKKIDVNDIKDKTKKPEQFIYPFKEITKVHKEKFKLEEYITENYISAMFSLEKGYIRKDLFNIMLCKEWENENFLKDTINNEYDKLHKEDKIELFKNIRNMPPKNVYFLLDKINKDKKFGLVSGDLYYQDIFEIASTEVFNNGDIKNYKNLIKDIRKTIKDRTDRFTGNGLFFHNDKAMGMYEKSTSSFVKIENMMNSEVINKKDLFEFIKKMEERSLSSTFTGIDKILLKKEGYDMFVNYFEEKYFEKKRIIKP